MNDRSRIENLHPHQGRLPRVAMLAIALALVLAALPASLFAQIQLDGNASKVLCPAGATCTNTDWDEVLLGNGGGNVASTGLVVDRPEPTFAQFSGGGSKDEQNIPNWRHRGGEPPSKDDLSHAFAAAFQKRVGTANHTILAFGMDRYDTSGDAQLGFWFLAQNAQPVAGGTFSGAHQDGDLLVLVNFSGGGDVPTIQVFEWQGGQNGGPVSVGIGGDVLCANGDLPSGYNFCGITNPGPGTTPAPWTYVSKGGGTSFPEAAFFEGAIDLTAAGLTGCFTGFIAESRSSTSITAVLKDFAEPGDGFNLCSISVSKECASPLLNASQNQITYTIRGKVRNTGSGRVYNVSLSDSPPANGVFQNVSCDDLQTPADSDSDGDNTFPLVSLAGGGEACYSNTITVPLAKDNNDTVTVTAKPNADLTGVTLTDSTRADCPNVTVPAALAVDGSCRTSIQDAGESLFVRVTVTGSVCNTGNSNLDEVDVSHSITGTVTLSKTTLSADTDPNIAGPQGECTTFTFAYTPTGANAIIPGNICFASVLNAKARDIFDAEVFAVPDNVDCSLCPDRTCAP